MGYFPNGTSGELYQDEFCSRCLFSNRREGISCPIWRLHLVHNYDECNKPDSFLHALIPRDGIDNERCKFFVDRGDLTPNQIEKFDAMRAPKRHYDA